MNKEIPQEDLEIEQAKPEQINDMVEGFSLTGDILKTIKDKKVTIKGWTKKEFDDFKNPEKKIRKTVLEVTLSNGATMDYIPNKTSLKSLMVKFGVMMGEWIGKVVELEVVMTKVSGEDKQVIYVKELI